MADDWARHGRSERRDDAPRSPGSSDWHADGAMFRFLARPVRPYRVVQRYRGDRVGQDADVSEWSSLWTLRSGDVSWPGSRKN